MSALHSTWHRALLLCDLWCVHGLAWAASGVIIDSPNNSASTYLPPAGGTATLPNYASIDFPANAFVNGQTVTVSATALAETGADWTTTSAIFGAATRAVYEVRIHTGMQAPSMPTSVRLNLPADYVATFPDDGEAKVFVQIFEDGGEETLDSFEIVDAVLSEGVLTATLPNTAFTNRRRIDANYEAVILIGMLRTKPTATSALKTMSSERHPSRPALLAEHVGGTVEQLFLPGADLVLVHIESFAQLGQGVSA